MQWPGAQPAAPPRPARPEQTRSERRQEGQEGLDGFGDPSCPARPAYPARPARSDSFPYHVRGVPVVFGADELLQLDVGRERGVQGRRPPLLKRTRIVERDLDFQMTEIGTPQTLDDVQLVAVRLAAETKPAPIAES